MSRQLKVLMVTGSFPPDICGVGDYVYKLFTELKTIEGLHITLFHERNWGIGNWVNIIRKIKAARVDIVHIQYPTEGYKYSLFPQVLAFLFRGKVILTLHELSNRNILGKMATILFLYISKRFIFTVDEELAYAERIRSLVNTRSDIINIGSNIPCCTKIGNVKRYEVTYFGHIRPVKGLERVIELAGMARKQGKGWRFLIAGQILPRFQQYYEQLLRDTKELNIEWELNVDENAVSRLLKSSEITYLPYPDGVSFRRGTFIAALGNDTIIITTKGANTPEDFNELCYLENETENVFTVVQKILNREAPFTNENVMKLKDNCYRYAERFSWKRIGIRHHSVYKIFAGAQKNSF